MGEDSVWRDGVRLRASSPEALIAEMTRQRNALKEIVEAQRNPDTTLKVEECFDGIWSILLRKAVRAHRATGIEVYPLWAMLPQNWECPCCRRTKADILVMADGVLLAKAVVHHDHFTSRINHSFQSKLGEKWAIDYPGSLDLQQTITANFLAFPSVVICESCNLADGEAKRHLQDRLKLSKNDLKDLSFAVDEIAAFIERRPNHHHAVRKPDLLELFEKKRKMEILRFRCQAVDEQVEMFKTGVHWRTREIHPSHDDIYLLAHDSASDLGIVPSSNFDIFIFSSTTKTGEIPKTLWRKNREWGRKFKTPSPQVAEEFIALKESLREAGPAWRCPSCGRSLRAVVRYSNKNTLSASIGRLGTYKDPTPACMDCVEVALGLAREAETDRDAITLDDVKSVIRPIPHTRHGIKTEIEIDRAVAKIRQRETPVVAGAVDDPFMAPGLISLF